MAYQSCFMRYELKYLLTRPQKEALLKVMEPYMKLDQYGRTIIRNIYYDTPNFRLIRRSIERPLYKEKLRLRSYKQIESEQDVFVELKRKFKKVVYKRRLAMPFREAADWLRGENLKKPPGQIGDELQCFRSFYGELIPTVFLSYEREAFYALDGSDFRVTMDENILARDHDLSLCSRPYGTALLPESMTLLELKAPGALPLWITKFLTENRIYKVSFSKYGTAYQKLLFKGGVFCV
ncbi:MAG: polyphosphate polymerase domain-containing protein [Oscillospiraceae bacterium]|nr:polyphosphate polymerase domain-containing protein [Oscillospiraceae bacterium]